MLYTAYALKPLFLQTLVTVKWGNFLPISAVTKIKCVVAWAHDTRPKTRPFLIEWSQKAHTPTCCQRTVCLIFELVIMNSYMRRIIPVDVLQTWASPCDKKCNVCGTYGSRSPTDCEISSHEDAIIAAVKRQPEDSSRDIAWLVGLEVLHDTKWHP
jgi:hypothetical protein